MFDFRVKRTTRHLWTHAATGLAHTTTEPGDTPTGLAHASTGPPTQLDAGLGLSSTPAS